MTRPPPAAHTLSEPVIERPCGPSVLGWPAWRRMAVVLPALVLLWLAVWWASVEALPL